MSPPYCPPPRVESFSHEVHPPGECQSAEELADRLEHALRSYDALREALMSAQRELARHQRVRMAATRVLAVVDAPTTSQDEERHLGRLGGALEELRGTLSGTPAPTCAEPFLAIARDRLVGRSWEPVSPEDCRRFLLAHGEEPVGGEGVRHG